MTIRDLARAESAEGVGDRPADPPTPSGPAGISGISTVSAADDGDTTLISAALDSATPAALMAGEVTARWASRPLSVFD
ncbi:MAG: L-serine ammonia-lyase, partial [Actinomyces massiliensis]